MHLGIESAPEEVCGLLVNEILDGEVTSVRVIQLRNRAEDPTKEYRIDSQTLADLALNPDVWAHVAVWHTHPGGLVGPSPGDLASKVPGVNYIVITVPTGEVVQF